MKKIILISTLFFFSLNMFSQVWSPWNGIVNPISFSGVGNHIATPVYVNSYTYSPNFVRAQLYVRAEIYSATQSGTFAFAYINIGNPYSIAFNITDNHDGSITNATRYVENFYGTVTCGGNVNIQDSDPINCNGTIESKVRFYY